MNELSLDAVSLRDGYSTGRLNPSIVIEIVLKRVKNSSGTTWISREDPETIESQAEHCSRLLETDPDILNKQPLLGIPFSVQDNIDVQGWKTTSGFFQKSEKAFKSAPIVQTLLNAGAILIGKTNLQPFACDSPAMESHWGSCHNPFDSDYPTGGPSSASALSVSLGLVSFCIGSDISGLGTLEASLNNIVCLRLANKTLSTKGIYTSNPSLQRTNIFVLNCYDSEFVLNVINSKSQNDYQAGTSTQPGGKGQTFTIGTIYKKQREFFGNTSSEFAFDNANKLLQNFDWKIREFDFKPLKMAGELLDHDPWQAEKQFFFHSIKKWHTYYENTLEQMILSFHEHPSENNYFKHLYTLERIRSLIHSVFERMDVLFLPAISSINTLKEMNCRPRESLKQMTYYSRFINLLGLASITLPTGQFVNRLPYGVTFLAPKNRLDILLNIGKEWQKRLKTKMGTKNWPIQIVKPQTRIQSEKGFLIAVAGLHMAGQPLNNQLVEKGGRFIQTARTARKYRMHLLKRNNKVFPGLVKTGFGCSVSIEIWELPESKIGAFMAEIPSPLGIGTLELENGSEVKGFICETWAVEGTPDISFLGNWRAYLRYSKKPNNDFHFMMKNFKSQSQAFNQRQYRSFGE